jgi:hypothetical protein
MLCPVVVFGISHAQSFVPCGMWLVVALRFKFMSQVFKMMFPSVGCMLLSMWDSIIHGA